MSLASQSRWRMVVWVAALGIPVGALIGVGGLTAVIYSGIRDISQTAMAQHRGDQVEALIALVESESQSLQVRNRAIWALGQLGDPRALPVLERHVTGEPCDHARMICQHEVGKAIRGCRGSTSAVRWIWRTTFGPHWRAA